MSAVAKYLQSYEDYFWQYEDGAKVIAVPEGHTLGYTEHIIKEIIFYLAPYELPRFGSLLLVLAATNSQGAKTLDDIARIVNLHLENADEVEKGIWFAKLLTQLPARYKKGNLRLELLRGIFMGSHNAIGTKKSTQILKELKDNPAIGSYSIRLKQSGLTELQIAKEITNDFKTLSIIGRELNSMKAIMARLSGLPKIDEDLKGLDLDLENQPVHGDLIEALTQKNETFYVSALVSRLISGLHIPFHSSLPSEQPLGGVADITNKGNFDKLLISEFAYDDQILMSRLANNESLYHHREVPPSENNYSRVILIDTTLKNWGTIRAISFATMLAITNHPKNKNPNRVFLVGKSYKEIAFNTVDDIIDGLQSLDSSLDPGVGLHKLFTTEAIKVSEIFFIGAVASLEGVAMQRFTAELGKRIDHWIHPNEDGEISVYKNPKRGKRFIQELKLPLAKLWVKPQKKHTQTITDFDIDYPILFPNARWKTKWSSKTFTFVVTRKNGLQRRLRYTDGFQRGYKLITTSFPPGDSMKAVMMHDDLSLTVLVGNQEKQFALINYPSGKRIPLSNFWYQKAYRDFYVDDIFFKCSSHAKTVCIDIEGNVTERDIEFRAKEETNDGFYASSLYQNVRRVFISDQNVLHFGKQDLVLYESGLYLMHQGNNEKVKIEASQPTSDLYEFPDGSSIMHNRNGMLTFSSSNAALPKIFVPCVLRSPLGVATEDTFAGNDFYQEKSRIEILLKNYESQKLDITKIIKTQLGNTDLKLSKTMADNGFIVSSDEVKMNKLMKALDDIGISYTVRRTGLQQQVISPKNFYDRYINLFINQIVTHGTGTS